MLPQDVRDTLQSVLQQPIRNITSVHGGCIAQSVCINTDHAKYFLKWSRDEVANTFPAEAAGLKALRSADSPILVPEPILAVDAANGRTGMLLLEWIETGRRGDDFWERFGRDLAELHQFSADRFGFEGDNYIGRLPQKNQWQDTWPAFFRICRLEPQVNLARSKSLWQRKWDAPMDRLYQRLDDLIPLCPKASILHGDLWSGNYMVSQNGDAVVIDPAVYYGHCDADLAMTELFGGFDRSFYDAYRDASPIETGYELRKDLYNLYHLINHLNHFGLGYAGSVAAIVCRF